MEKNKISNFLTPDISYLLGLITGRGEIQYNVDIKRIVIDFEYKTQKVIAGSLSLDQKLHIQTSLDSVVIRLQNMGINVQKDVSDKKISLALKWEKEDISWLFIKFLINGTRFSYHNFQIPEPIFDTSDTNKKEFLRGLSDVTAYVRDSNKDQRGKHRVYIEISNKNWYIPPQLCQLFQSLNIAVQYIGYGHPNLRSSKSKSTTTSWAKEHQMKIFAEDFEKVGFYISHKNEVLQELSVYNKKNFTNSQKLCDGTSQRKASKRIHPHETHEKLPQELQGKHFNGFKEICKCLYCYKQN
ncbi:hypothetical protein ATE92_0585 [Ulvibacter sp. MAR_2010_11]|uniref:hypothetical protein n=1 Tax=Ulvibacter sp. MAR_2010_11 TaxID=1250229 RepID=UPI000C2C6847|nr:hypothetical protein [Ulvibacter sp. MAR_2010_11]PKA82456.1 hypothetical protein ATE92_0585 [Ulvibacter sp. MAR_2010_11]